MELDAGVLLAAGLIFALRVASAALATVRVLVMSRGEEVWAAFLGFFEVLVYVVSIGLVVSDITNVTAVFAYCLGFSAGTILGMRMEQKLALGMLTLRIISRTHAPEVAAALRSSGLGATLSWGEGRDGSVGIVQSVVPRRRAAEAGTLARSVDDHAFIVADEARAVLAGWMPLQASMRPREGK